MSVNVWYRLTSPFFGEFKLGTIDRAQGPAPNDLALGSEKESAPFFGEFKLQSASEELVLGPEKESTAPDDLCDSESSTATFIDTADSPRSSHGSVEESVLTIRGLSGNILCTLPTSLNSSWKGSDLRQRITAKTGIPVMAQKLIAGDEELDRLDEFKVAHNMEITLLMRSAKVVEWIEKLQTDGFHPGPFLAADEDVRRDPLICLAALSADRREPWQHFCGELLRDDEFLAAAYKQDNEMFLNTRCLATNMDFLHGCAKLRASGRMNWGSRGPIDHGLMMEYRRWGYL
jgi:hypothetical protein